VKIAEGSRGEKIFRIKNNGISSNSESADAKMFVLKNFLTSSEVISFGVQVIAFGPDIYMVDRTTYQLCTS